MSARIAAILVLGASSLAMGSLLGIGCDGQTSPSGLGEPIVVRAGAFQEGDLPGSPPLGDVEVDAGAKPEGPHVTVLDSANRVLIPGQSGKQLGGRVTDDASSVGLRFGDLGTGFWVVPLGAPDPQNPGELGWSLVYDVGHDVPPGLHPLRVAAIDDSGGAGTQKELVVCVTSAVPDNLNACDTTISPPFAVLSLGWDADVDLDLVLVTPEGKIVDPKHPSTSLAVDGGVAPGPSDGALDRDSDANCVIDGVRRENVVWQKKPRAGDYLVYARLCSACSLSAARFTASLWFAEPTGPKTWAQVERVHVSGEVRADEARGDQGLGDYVTDFSIH
jgi:hypothetical protein